MQGMFGYGTYDATPLSDCHKLATHTSFEAQVPSVWTYDWGAVACATPSSPPSPSRPPAPPPPPPAPPPPPSPPKPPWTPATSFADKASLQAALAEWCLD